MEIVVAKSQSEGEAADQIVSVEDLRELTSLQLAMVGGGLANVTFI
ncbi:MAG: hypothetical protein ACK5V8_01690 [Betaproteobacteria bacterium]